MKTDIKVGPKTFQERAARAPVWVKKTITHADLTETTADTAQAIELFSLPANHAIGAVQVRLRTAFKDASDAAFNTTTMSVGHSTDPDAWLTASETNENGTEVPLVREVKASGGIASQSAATTVNATFNAMAAKALNDIDTGQVDIFCEVIDYDQLDASDEED